MPHKAVYSQSFKQIGWPKYTMNILAAHLNTSRATEMYLTNLELADTGCQNVVYHIMKIIEYKIDYVIYLLL